jgi:protein phosphatase
MRVRIGERSDIGLRREVNQDMHGSTEGGYGMLLVVCDGMGGHTAGEVASRVAVETILATMSAEPAPEDALRAAFVAANTQVYAVGHGSMGTTGVAALLQRNMLYVANVGDSRAYLVREGEIQQISTDHSFVSDQVAAGLMTAEQARHSNVRNIITRALGHLPEVTVDTFSLPLRPGDTIVLSSDGMHGLIEDHEIAEITAMLPPMDAVERLVNTANDRGGIDNITVMIAQVDEIDPPEIADHTEQTTPDTHATFTALPAAEAPPEPALPTERPLSLRSLLIALFVFMLLINIGGYVLFVPGAIPASAPTTLPMPVTTTVLPNPSPSPLPTPTLPVAP